MGPGLDVIANVSLAWMCVFFFSRGGVVIFIVGPGLDMIVNV